MSKEQQIEEMANDLRQAEFWDVDEDCCDLELDRRKTAENLYNAGYRKQSAIEKVENKLFKDAFEGVLFSLVYLGADGKWHTKRNNAEKTTAIIERYLKLVTIEKGGAE